MSEKSMRAAELGSAAGQALQAVLGAREHVKAAESRADTWRTVLNQRVKKAMAAGVPAEILAERLGVSVQRIYQMRSEAPE